MQNEADFLEKQFGREFSNLLDKDIQLQNYNEIERLRIELNSHLTKSSSEKKEQTQQVNEVVWGKLYQEESEILKSTKKRPRRYAQN